MYNDSGLSDIEVVLLGQLKQKAIFRGILYICIEICAVAVVSSRLGLPTNLYSKTDVPPYIFLDGFFLIAIMFFFSRFMFSFMDSDNYRIRPRWLVALFAITSLASIIFLFAALHRWTGIYAGTIFVCKQGECMTISPIVHDFGDCIYFSVITLTTVGYGDFQPIDSGLSHTIAGAEALSGYVILGILVSSLFAMLRPAVSFSSSQHPTLNRPGISEGSNSQVDWSRDEQNNEQIQP